MEQECRGGGSDNYLWFRLIYYFTLNFHKLTISYKISFLLIFSLYLLKNLKKTHDSFKLYDSQFNVAILQSIRKSRLYFVIKFFKLQILWQYMKLLITNPIHCHKITSRKFQHDCRPQSSRKEWSLMPSSSVGTIF